MNILTGRYPIDASMRDGKNLLLRNSLEAQIQGGRHDGFEYDTKNDMVTISSPIPYLDHKTKVTLHGV